MLNVARASACRVRTPANTFLLGFRRGVGLSRSVHTSVNAARMSACATPES
jgi:hypothetical protein